MKLVVAIVQKEDAGTLIDALTEKGYRATRINTAGGFLKEGNATVLVGVEDSAIDEVLSLIESTVTLGLNILILSHRLWSPVSSTCRTL